MSLSCDILVVIFSSGQLDGKVQLREQISKYRHYWKIPQERDSSQKAAVLSAQRYLGRIIILMSIGAINPTPLDDLVPQKKT